MTARRTIIHVHLDALTFERDYQRAIDPNRVRKLIDDFNPDGLGTLTVSLRPDGERIIIDGQHRATAARNVEHHDKVTCVQFEGLTIAEEASLFLLLNNSKLVAPIDKFRARVISGDKDANVINDVLRQHGWTVASGGVNGYFGAVAAIEKVYNGAGITPGPRDDLVHVVAYVTGYAWGHDAKGAHHLIVLGLGMVFARFGADVDTKKVADELAKETPSRVIGHAKTLQAAHQGTVANAVAEHVTGLHNKGRRTHRLPDWRWSR